MTVMSQEELIVNTKTVVQGLEALKTEHSSILNSLQELSSHLNSSPLVEEKQHLIKKSLDMIELGLGEAQVGKLIIFLSKQDSFMFCSSMLNSNDFYSGYDGISLTSADCGS